ncbi:MAG TPA: right-handed parallel beta-helix repeat-containing protein, partial [Candidatus Paceibacterota bacterium]|nr:right-handed parallel beta-helix repeat-containing protein [Candidatus Paceibacterota bacterium]
ALNDQFGTSVAISADGTKVTVGAPFADIDVNANQGAAYVFASTSESPGWTQEKKLTASDGAAGDTFGQAVGMSSDGGTIAVGSPGVTSNKGAVYVYTGASWVTETKLTAPDGSAGDEFGYVVAVSGDGLRVATGANLHDVDHGSDPDTNEGAAYVFTYTAGWDAGTELSPETAGQRIGTSVSLNSDGSRLVTGTYTYGSAPGSIYVYTDDGGWNAGEVHSASDGTNTDGFGISNAISSDGKWIGVGGSGIKEAYIFTSAASEDLTVTVGEHGVVSSGDGTIADCRSGSGTCNGTYAQGDTVTLTANADPGWLFSGWTGDGCTSSDNPLVVTMSDTIACTASFTETPQHTLTVVLAGDGTGTVTGGDIDCGDTCSALVHEGVEVSLDAEPGDGSAFAGWSGEGCSADFTMGTGDMTCTATFQPQPGAVYVDSAWESQDDVDTYNSDNDTSLVWQFDAFSSIQDAIDTTSAGGTVHVLSGEYDEELSIDKPLTLEGLLPESGRGPAEEAPEIFDTVCTTNDAVSINASGVTVEGFQIHSDDCGGFDVYVNDDLTDVHILNNDIYNGDEDDTGVLLDNGSSGIEVARNLIHDIYMGVYTITSSGDTITDNTISDVDTSGILLSAGSTGNTITGNVLSTTYLGVSLIGSSNENTISDNQSTYATVGFRLAGRSNGNMLTGNSADTGGGGFIVGSSSENVLNRNEASENGLIGFFLNDHSSNNELTSNIAVGNDNDGFRIAKQSNNNTLDDNIAAQNSNGIHNINSSGAVIDSNVIGYATIAGDEYVGNEDGILIDSGSDITITNNQIIGNENCGSGIHLGGSAGTGIVAHYNNITGNACDGIDNGSAHQLDATNNFWGSSAGPGDENNDVTEGVTVEPFLASNSPQLVDGKIPSNLFTSGVFEYNGTASSSTQITVNGNVTLSNLASSSVDLADGTVITSAGSFNVASVSIGAPDPGTLAGLAVGSVVEGTLEWGIPNLGLTFNPAITLHIWVGRDLDGQVLQIVRSPSGTGDWTTDGLVDTTCTVADGLCIFQATKASTYVPCLGACTSSGGGSSRHETPTPTPTPPPSGGGGGVAYVPPTPTPTPSPTPAVCRRAENSLVRYEGDTKVYVLQNCIKHWIMTADDFNRFGYNWANITVIPSSETYPDGATVGTGTPAPTPAPSGTYVFTKFLSRGSRGEEVRQLQLKLKSLGFFPADVDATGLFGPTTVGAVKAFQKANGIAQVGFVGPATRAALNR